MADQDGELERTTVRTYVPKYQRDEWDDHADELDMSRSEFVRSMVQAGRRGFLDGSADTAPPGDADTETESTAGQPSTEGGVPDLETQVLAALSGSEHRSWEELLAAVTDDIEDRLEATLQDLQAADRVRYSGRNGGYTLDE